MVGHLDDHRAAVVRVGDPAHVAEVLEPVEHGRGGRCAEAQGRLAARCGRLAGVTPVHHEGEAGQVRAVHPRLPAGRGDVQLGLVGEPSQRPGDAGDRRGAAAGASVLPRPSGAAYSFDHGNVRWRKQATSVPAAGRAPAEPGRGGRRPGVVGCGAGVRVRPRPPRTRPPTCPPTRSRPARPGCRPSSRARSTCRRSWSTTAVGTASRLPTDAPSPPRSGSYAIGLGRAAGVPGVRRGREGRVRRSAAVDEHP